MAWAKTEQEAIKKAEILMSKGWYLEALPRLEAIVKDARAPQTRAKALFFIGKIHSRYLNQKETALSYFNTILDTYPQSREAPDALYNKGLIYYDQGQYEKAQAVFNRYEHRYPNQMRKDSAKLWASIAKPKLTPKNTEGPTRGVRYVNRIKQECRIRVLIKKSRNHVCVSSQKPLTVTDPVSRKMLYFGWGPLRLGRKDGVIVINGRKMGRKLCRISSGVPAIQIDGRLFRGAFTVFCGPEGLSVVNELPLENYLYGVIPEEVPDSWPVQALKAQAVAARTYALYSIEKNFDKPYDVESTTASQVYGGYLSESVKATSAAQSTNGRILVYESHPIIACYHSNSGGYTEDPVNVWHTTLPYLQAIPDQYSRRAKKAEWQTFLTYETIHEQLRADGMNFGRIESVRTEGKTNSGRNLSVVIDASSGSHRISCHDFRTAMGETRLKSTWFNITPHAKGIFLKGKGKGHGVGMSQWGAYRMAQTGLNYKQILNYYYQNIQIAAVNI